MSRTKYIAKPEINNKNHLIVITLHLSFVLQLRVFSFIFLTFQYMMESFHRAGDMPPGLILPTNELPEWGKGLISLCSALWTPDIQRRIHKGLSSNPFLNQINAISHTLTLISSRFILYDFTFL